MNHCSRDDLYNQFITLIKTVTGRDCWRKYGIQSQPAGTYATLELSECTMSPVSPVAKVSNTQTLITDPAYSQVAWGQSLIQCKVEFFRNELVDTAFDAAIRFRNSLLLEDRYWDVWNYCGLVGDIRMIDVSTMFRADVEGRAEIRFSIYANLSNPLPLPNTNITDISEFELKVYRDSESTDNLVIDTNIPE